jgi:cytochrome c oxidase assembly protein subunit 15
MSLTWIVFNGLLFFQSALIVTGGAVRLTGSGLGCPTWPQCTGNSIKPIAHQAQGQLHAWIEFGNRLVAWIIFILAIIAIFLVVKKFRDRADFGRLRALAILQLLGFLGQVVLGGITVLTKLNPITVSAHFLLTIPLIAGALSLRNRIYQKPTISISKKTTSALNAVLVLTIIVLFVGTLVTGTGPHAGDIQARRYHFGERNISFIHGGIVFLLIAAILYLLISIRANDPKEVTNSFGQRALILLFIALAQMAIGYIQYLTKLPEILVASHLVGATFIWVSAWGLYISATRSKI